MNVNTSTLSKLQMFNQLQSLFLRLTILIHFDSGYQLYINLDTFKKYSFSAYVYYRQNDEKADSDTTEIKQKNIKFIYFLSHLLSNAEIRYWPTELKVAGLI